MIDTETIFKAVYKKITDSELFTYYDTPNFINTAEKNTTWLEVKPITPLSEETMSLNSETGIYIIDLAVYVAIGTTDAILDQKQLALGELLDPKSASNLVFTDAELNVTFNIFRVERLGNFNYNKNWRQGTVRVSIRKFKNS
jgi:hypothetical protein